MGHVLRYLFPYTTLFIPHNNNTMRQARLFLYFTNEETKAMGAQVTYLSLLGSHDVFKPRFSGEQGRSG